MWWRGRPTIISRSRATNRGWKAQSPCCSKRAATLFSSRSRRPIMAASRRGAFGAVRRSMATLTPQRRAGLSDRNREIALGITSRTPQEASPQRVLAVNRDHWSIESVHHIIDWNYDEDPCQIRTGFGPENVTRPRRFAVGILKSCRNPRNPSLRGCANSRSGRVSSSTTCA